MSEAARLKTFEEDVSKTWNRDGSADEALLVESLKL